jgi:hypothetical protein
MFDGTIESLKEAATDLPIQRERQIAMLLIEYEQMEETTCLPDPRFLEEAHHRLYTRLQSHEVDQELAHLAVALAYHRSDWSDIEQVLQQYRQHMLPLYEAAWAWWHRVDFLALTGNAPATVAEQRAFIGWARMFLPPAHRLCTMSDTTQALNWLTQGMGREWFDRSQRLLLDAPVETASRFDRFLLLRSMLTLALRMQDEHRITDLFARLDALTQEDLDGERTQEIRLETLALRLSFANVTQNSSLLHTLGAQAQTDYAHLAAQWQEPTLRQRHCLRRLAHNLGAELYEAHHYDLALPLFEHAIHLNATSPFTYLWLAGCVWALQKDKQRVLALLQQARTRDSEAGFQAKLYSVAELNRLPLV